MQQVPKDVEISDIPSASAIHNIRHCDNNNSSLISFIPLLSRTEPNMSDSPAVKDLPKMGDTLKGELLSPRNLKDVETAEKNVLPTADDVKAEKTHQARLSLLNVAVLFCDRYRRYRI